ncbi:uncharacterized [Tachysurus ichikawai]
MKTKTRSTSDKEKIKNSLWEKEHEDKMGRCLKLILLQGTDQHRVSWCDEVEETLKTFMLQRSSKALLNSFVLKM